MQPSERLIPIREAFLMMGLKLTRGYAEIAAGRIQAVRNGRRTFVRSSEIERYIDSLPTIGRSASASPCA